MLVCFEGIDRSGKSSTTKHLAEALRGQGHKVELIAFPDRSAETITGPCIASLLKRPATDDTPSGDEKTPKTHAPLDERATHLLFSSNRFERETHIRKRLAEGYIVVLDRYILSGLAYSAAKGLPVNWCARTDHGLPWPDLTIFLDADTDVTSKRAGFGAEIFETVHFQSIVYRKYRDLIGYLRTYAHTCPPAESHLGIGGIQMIDVASKSIDEMHKQVLDITTKCLAAVKAHNEQIRDASGNTARDFTIDF